MEKSYKRMLKYFSKNPSFSSWVHFLGGVGVGFILTYPLAGSHPVRWGVAFITVSILGHLWAATQ
ncbi:hypothetical protein A3A79_04165 [Candidatus Gottesmanbacteria bacterium RIFCSPLOWO2_01_FULL_43_11b]|uniref:DUF962 family protein n=1 Tax=Candidatus Gottesmanbacteria bacterium RIFCSPLOWO2_01_FULL_43_11b TaxID=1798392 RepID=A0A1F6AI33_9BACT|nr:MAG: hypothetical protein A3A79_04165 [Candidatus Gottesmanbacteria bacterium RIFCSPLOWO2_01_FULL_43_11b]